MAWIAPMTAVSNTAFLSSQFNTHVRDNLLETEAAKATVEGGFFLTTGLNSIVQRKIATAYQDDLGMRELSTAYGDLHTLLSNGTVITGQTPGPSVTVSTGTRAIIFLEADISHDGVTTQEAFASFQVTGASSLTNETNMNNRSIMKESGTGTTLHRFRLGTVSVLNNLTPGDNIFTMKYRNSVSTVDIRAWFRYRRITVIPL